MVIDEAERNEIQLQQTSRGLMRQLRCEIYVLSLRERASESTFATSAKLKYGLFCLREYVIQAHATRVRQIPCFSVN